MVFESIVVELVNKYLGDFIENLDKSQLKIGLWGGKLIKTKTNVICCCMTGRFQQLVVFDLDLEQTIKGPSALLFIFCVLGFIFACLR